MARTKQRASMPLYGTPGNIRPANADAELLMAAAAQMAAQVAAQRAIIEPRAESVSDEKSSIKNSSDKENKKPTAPRLRLTLSPARKVMLKFTAAQWNSSPDATLVNSSPFPSLKRPSNDDELTYSDCDLATPKSTKAAKSDTNKVIHAATPVTKRPTKKIKVTATAGFDNVDHHFNDHDGDVEMSDDEDNTNDIFLVEPKLKRTERMVDPNKPEDAALIVQATKAGSEIYDSDAEDLAGNVKDAGNPGLYRNVKWGIAATSFENFEQTEPFVDFVPGRWERQPDSSVRDQKYKLLVKFVDLKGKQKIFKNPPPKDWNDQTALTALNKRSVQQWRRNTKYRFRKVVIQYMHEERVWILEHLNVDGKPTVGWKRFVKHFNEKFAGKIIDSQDEPRPARTQSSLTKEIERFTREYKAGQVPVPAKRAAAKGKGQSKTKVTAT